jgi:hypothetical protein
VLTPAEADEIVRLRKKGILERLPGFLWATTFKRCVSAYETRKGSVTGDPTHILSGVQDAMYGATNGIVAMEYFNAYPRELRDRHYVVKPIELFDWLPRETALAGRSPLVEVVLSLDGSPRVHLDLEMPDGPRLCFRRLLPNDMSGHGWSGEDFASFCLEASALRIGSSMSPRCILHGYPAEGSSATANDQIDFWSVKVGEMIVRSPSPSEDRTFDVPTDQLTR